MIFRGKKRRNRTIIQLIAWLVNGLVYFGAANGVEQQPGENFFRDYFLLVAVEIPASIAAIYGCSKFGRKWTVTVPMFTAGVFCITVSAFTQQSSELYTSLRLIFLLFAKISITVSFDALYTWSVELYPTVIRAQGLAVSQTSSRIGMAFIPLLQGWLRNLHPVLPFSLIGLASFASAVSLLWLPETRGAKTAEALADEEYEVKPGAGGTSFSNLGDQAMSLDDFHM